MHRWGKCGVHKWGKFGVHRWMIALAGKAYASILTELFTDASILKTGPKLPHARYSGSTPKQRSNRFPARNWTWRYISCFWGNVWQMFGMECATLACQPWFNKNFWPYWVWPVFLLQCWNKVFLSRIVFFSGLCIGKTGCLHDGSTLAIQRGVKQGDVISPILFNATLESAMRKWKLKLQHHWWSVYRCVWTSYQHPLSWQLVDICPSPQWFCAHGWRTHHST